MFSAALRVLRIKDLKDLSVLREAGYYRHAGPTDLKRCFFSHPPAALRRQNIAVFPDAIIL